MNKPPGEHEQPAWREGWIAYGQISPAGRCGVHLAPDLGAKHQGHIGREQAGNATGEKPGTETNPPCRLGRLKPAVNR